MNEWMIFIWVLGSAFTYGILGPTLILIVEPLGMSKRVFIVFKFISFVFLFIVWPITLGAAFGRPIAAFLKEKNYNFDSYSGPDHVD